MRKRIWRVLSIITASAMVFSGTPQYQYGKSAKAAEVVQDTEKESESLQTGSYSVKPSAEADVKETAVAEKNINDGGNTDKATTDKVTVGKVTNGKKIQTQSESSGTRLKAKANVNEMVYGDFKYMVDNSSVTITGYTGDGGDITVPDKIDGMSVKSINGYVFDGKSGVTSVKLPSQLTYLGAYVFRGTSITDITIPNTLSECGTYEVENYKNGYAGPFAGAEKLTTVTFEDGIKEIPAFILSTYYNDKSGSNVASNITAVNLPESVEKIGQCAFQFNTKLSDNFFAKLKNLKQIYYGAFIACKSLKNIVLPGSIREIGDHAIWACDGLESVEFAASADDTAECSMHELSFGKNESLKKVKFSNLNKAISVNAFQNCKSLTDIEFTDSTLYISKYAFESCESLTSVKLPSKLEMIGRCAFSNTGLTQITIPKTVNDCMVDDEVKGPFYNTLGLKTIDFANGTEEITTYLCAGSDITQITIPKTVKKIDDRAFIGCEKLEKLIFEENSDAAHTCLIGQYAFSKNTTLSDIEFSSNVTSIDDYAFSECKSISSINLPKNIAYLGSSVFSGTNIGEVVVPKSLKECAKNDKTNGPFSGTLQLSKVEFEQETYDIPASVLANNKTKNYIKQVVIPATVESVGTDAFSHCTNITIYGVKNSYAQSYAQANNIPFEGVDVTKYANVSDIIYALNPSKLIDDVSLGEVVINGPEIVIADKKFPLFTFNAGLEMKLKDNMQIRVDMEDKKIQVLFGFKQIDGDTKLNADTAAGNEWVKDFSRAKSIYKISKENGVGEWLDGEFAKTEDKLEETTCMLGTKAKVRMAGYMEFGYATGDIKYISGGMVADTRYTYKQSVLLKSYPSTYTTFDMSKSDSKTGFSFKKIKELQYAPEINSKDNYAVSVGMAVSEKKLNPYARVGMTGTVTLGTNYPADSLSGAITAEFSGNIYMRSNVFGFDGPSYNSGTNTSYSQTELYPENKSASQDALKDFDWSTAKQMSRSYSTSSNVGSSESVTLSNTYPYNNVKAAALDDGTKLMVWITDDNTKSDVNRTSIVYSVCDKTNKTWSTPSKISASGGADMYPQICSDGKKAVISWQRAAQVSSSATMKEVIKTSEIYEAVYQNGSMGSAYAVTDSNSVYEMMQTQAVSGENTAFAWVENSEDDPFMLKGTNTIKVASGKDNNRIVKTISSGKSVVRNLTLGYVSGQPVIAYETEESGENVIYLKNGQDEKKIAGESAQIEKGILYYLSDGALKTYDLITKKDSKTGIMLSNDFEVADNGETKAIFTTSYDGFTSFIEMYKFDRTTGSWADPVRYKNSGKFIRSYSAAVDADGKPFYAANSSNINSSASTIDTSTELYVPKMSVYDYDIEFVTAPYYDESLVSAGAKLPIKFKIKNNGNSVLEKYKVQINETGGSMVFSQEVACNIAPGETAEGKISYTLPSSLSYKEYTFNVYALEKVGTSWSALHGSSKKKLTIGYPDIEIANLYMSGKKADAYFEGVVKNTVDTSVSDIKLNLYYGDSDTAFKTENIGKIVQGGGGVSFKVAIPSEYLETNPAADSCIRVEAVSDAKELNYANNEKTYIITQNEKSKIRFDKTKLSLNAGDKDKISIAYSDIDTIGQNIKWSSDNDDVVSVDIAGNITAYKSGKAMVTAKLGDAEADCEVTVLSDKDKIKAVTLDKEKMSLEIGQRSTLKAQVFPESISYSDFIWKSSDDSVAKVSQKGDVTAAGAGTATITAATADGMYNEKCIVNVLLSENASFVMSFEGGEQAVGNAPSVIAAVGDSIVNLPENTFTKAGMEFAGWSDGKDIYKAGSSYRVPYKNVKFTARWSKNGVMQYIINANAGEHGKISPSGQTAVDSGKSMTYSIAADTGYQIKDILADGESIGKKDSYTFINVDSDHTITATFKKAPDEKITVRKITLNKTEAGMYVGDTLMLTAGVTPENATNKTFRWVSENSGVAVVDGDGKVTAVSAGTAVIKAKANDGSYVYASCVVSVLKKAEPTPDNTVSPSVTPVPTNDGNTDDTQRTPLPSASAGATFTTNPQKTMSPEESVKPSVYPKVTQTPSQSPKATVKPTVKPSATPVSTNRPTDSSKPSGPVIRKKGTKIKDTKTKAYYKVVKSGSQKEGIVLGAQLEYVKPVSSSKKVSIPSTLAKGGVQYKVVSVGAKAFKNNLKIKEVSIGQNVTTVGKEAFSGCKKLVTLKLGGNIKTISDKAFYKCTSVKKLSIPSKVKKIGKNAFYGCSGLKDLTVKTKKLTSKTVGKGAFKKLNKKAKIKVPKSKLKLYAKILKR